MTFVPHALEWVRALLFGPRKPSRSNHAAAAHPDFDEPAQPPAYAVQPSPEVWGALLVLARLRRAGRATGALNVRHCRGEASALVRTYVLMPEEHQRTISSREFMGVSR